MLIRFTVENFLSFCDKAEFSMIAGNARKHSEHLTKLNKPGNLRVLKAGIMYGANAAGKSNFVKAIDCARSIILSGHEPKEPIYYKPYRFSKDCQNKPTSFSFEFSTETGSYIYGFSFDVEKFHEEWLYEIKAKSETMVFDRHLNADGNPDIEFGSGISFTSADDRNFLEFTARGTRKNQLFLYETINRNVDKFKHIFDWFYDSLVIVYPDSKRHGLIRQFMVEEKFKERFEDLLRSFDTGVSTVKLEEVDIQTIDLPSALLEDMNKVLLTDSAQMITLAGSEGQRYLINSEDGEIKAQKIRTGHVVDGQTSFEYLDAIEESDGTQRLFDIIPGLLDLFNGDKVFIIDELDRSLHPHLTRSILKLFLEAINNRNQLIVTTHESSLLDLDLLRRDEIWFVEKQKEGKSELYSLEEYAPRHDMDIRKGYLLGRYGSIPFINIENAITWDDESNYAKEEI